MTWQKMNLMGISITLSKTFTHLNTFLFDEKNFLCDEKNFLSDKKKDLMKKNLSLFLIHDTILRFYDLFTFRFC